MPKETIRGCLQAPESDAESVAEVRWGRDGDYVQLVTRFVNRALGTVHRGNDEEYAKAVDLSLATHKMTPEVVDLAAFDEEQRKIAIGHRYSLDIDPYRITPAERDWLLGYLIGQFGHGLLVADGFFVDVDRRGINDLIRHLRRARDQAYGRDE